MPKMIVLNEDQEEALIELLNSFISDFNYYTQECPPSHVVNIFNKEREKQVEDIIYLCQHIYQGEQESYIEEVKYGSLKAYYNQENPMIIVEENGFKSNGLLSNFKHCNQMIEDNYVARNISDVKLAIIKLNDDITTKNLTPESMLSKGNDNRISGTTINSPTLLFDHGNKVQTYTIGTPRLSNQTPY
ncbi:hypothetical protein L3V79_04940 [Thiotrichales bacterium 19S9-12]|nr:hypothetical protein [Thiotrichales bacterium 19S9-11]MCF6811703.1 hypothetical protein [Thiotrichales bacterium 19S9-12]